MTRSRHVGRVLLDPASGFAKAEALARHSGAIMPAMPPCTRRAAIVSALAVCLISASPSAQRTSRRSTEGSGTSHRAHAWVRREAHFLRRGAARVHWPSFRGREAAGVADGQQLPDHWSPATGANIRWRLAIPGLAHSSPIVWGDLLFVTSAISSRPDATFKPGLYGDGDASDDRSAQRWMLYAIDKRTGRIRWERLAAQGEPRNKRHIKSTYASSSPATDGRIVIAWFGSQGIYAYDFDGGLRWSVDLGRVDMGAYDLPSYEWGPASSPIIWNGLVIVQCDTQTDSFLLALDAATGATVWKTDRQELPSWGTPTVVNTSAGPELITNASNFVRGYDPRTGRELWHLGGSSKITAPTPIFANGLHIVASGRAPERPVFAVRPGARGDLTLAPGATENRYIAWSKTGRGSYMPTPLAYRGIVVRAGQQRCVRCVQHHHGEGDLSSAAAARRQRIQRVARGRGREDLSVQRGWRDARHHGWSDVRARGHELHR